MPRQPRRQPHAVRQLCQKTFGDAWWSTEKSQRVAWARAQLSRGAPPPVPPQQVDTPAVQTPVRFSSVREKQEALTVRFYAECQKWGLRGWTLKWVRSRRTAGTCNYAPKCRIHISLLYLQNTSWGENVDALLHELAHARTPGAHHGPVWKNAAVEMGCTGKRCCNAFDQPAYLGGMLSEAGRC